MVVGSDRERFSQEVGCASPADPVTARSIVCVSGSRTFLAPRRAPSFVGPEHHKNSGFKGNSNFRLVEAFCIEEQKYQLQSEANVRHWIIHLRHVTLQDPKLLGVVGRADSPKILKLPARGDSS